MTDSTDVAKRDDNQQVDVQGTPPSVMSIFGSPSFKRQVAAALPQHMRVDSLMRIAMTEVRKNPELEKCTPASFMGALLTAAQLGLRPGYNGEGWIIPRWSGKLKCLEAQFQPGYRGLAQLAYRSGEVADIVAEAVYAADHFAYQLGSDSRIEHKPDMEAEHRDEDIVAFYAVISLTNGGRIMKVMSKAQVDDVRDRFAPKDKGGRIVGPWKSDYAPMGCKTVLLRAFKFAPMESERLSAAIQVEEDALFGDRIAQSVVEPGQTVADRVAAKLGVDSDTGEVIEGTASDDALFDGEDA